MIRRPGTFVARFRSAQTYRLSPIWRQPLRAPWITPLLSYSDVVGTLPPRFTGKPVTGTLITMGIVVVIDPSARYTAPSYRPGAAPAGAGAGPVNDWGAPAPGGF